MVADGSLFDWHMPIELQEYLSVGTVALGRASERAGALLQQVVAFLSWTLEVSASLDMPVVQYLCLHIFIFIAFYLYASPLRAKQRSRESWYDFATQFGTGCLLAMVFYHSKISSLLQEVHHFYFPAILVVWPVLLVADCLLRLPPLRRTLRITNRSFVINANLIAWCMCVQYSFCQSSRVQSSGLAKSLVGWSSWVNIQYSALGEGSSYCHMLEQPMKLPVATFLTILALGIWSIMMNLLLGRGILLGDPLPKEIPPLVAEVNGSESPEDHLLKIMQEQRATEAKRLLDERPTMCPWYTHRCAWVGLDMFLTLKVFLGRFDARLMRSTMERASNSGRQKGVDRKFANRDDLWFDFVADTGDGFNSTYAIARSLAQLNLNIKVPRNSELLKNKKVELPSSKIVAGDLTLPRGELLVHGGDLAYPNPSMACYEERLFQPWEAALPCPPGADPVEVSEDMQAISAQVAEGNSSPTCWMIPGNHDWFDGLEAFLHCICGRHWIGGWHLPQTSTYWALELPHSWYLFGIDLALTDDFDDAQYTYFRRLAAELPPNANVIVICHQPYWFNDAYYLRESTPLYQRLHALLGKKLRMRLAGDIHNYMRHSPKPPEIGPELVISGGGGAFLHPTHLGVIIPGYKESAVFPSKSTSRWIAMQNPWMFRSRNLSIEMSFGLLYVAMVIGVFPLCGDAERAFESLYSSTSIPEAIAGLVCRAYGRIIEESIVALTAHLFLLLCCVNFVEAHWGSVRAFAYAMALFLANSVAAVAIACSLELALLTLSYPGHMKQRGPNAKAPPVISDLGEPWAGIGIYVFHVWIGIFDLPSRIFAARTTMCAAGASVSRFTHASFLLCIPFFWVLAMPIASFIFGTYLAVTSWMGRHLDEAFSSMRVANYKNFLRMHIDKTGALTMYALGIAKIPTMWDDDPHCSQNRGSKQGAKSTQFTPSRWKPKKPMHIKLVDSIVLPARAEDTAGLVRSRSMKLPRVRSKSADRTVFHGH